MSCNNNKGTTEPGHVNRNGQITIRNTGETGTDFGASKYQLACSHCGYNYGANGGDIWERKCPNPLCPSGQHGRPGLPLNIRVASEDQQGKRGVAGFVGKWPGEESDEELLDALDDLRK
jgi:hypothetical protein